MLFTCNYVVSVLRGFLFLWVLGMGYVILLWHSLGLPYNYYAVVEKVSQVGAGPASDHWGRAWGIEGFLYPGPTLLEPRCMISPSNSIRQSELPWPNQNLIHRIGRGSFVC